jgi:Tol biopolymer transport system component
MVYASDATGNLDVYLQGVGAPTPINLTKDSPADDDQPAFSPDGERIAFRSGRDGGGLFVMGRTGELVKKTIDRGFNPSWSPDGQAIVFSTHDVAANPGSRALSGAELWTVAVGSGETRRLAVTDGLQPAWSPDGARIAYWGYAPKSRNREIWTASVNGGEPVRVTEHPAIDWNPVWAPDGRHLYFGSDRGGALGLWRIAIDPASGQPGGAPESIQLPATLAAHFSLSADGNRMAFASFHLSTQVYGADFDARLGTIASPIPITRGSRTWTFLDASADGRRLVMTTGYPQEDVFVADASGENLRQITSDVASDRGVRWSPDGQRILYYSAKPGETMHIFTMGPDGSDVRPVTTEVPPGGLSWVFPQWAPGGGRLAAFNIGSDGYLFEPAGADTWRQVVLPRVGVNKEAFTPDAWTVDGRRIAGVTDRTGQLVVYDIDRQTYDETGLLGFAAQRGSAWLPDGRRILATHTDNIVMVDVATRQVLTVLDAPARQAVSNPRLTADGRRMFYLYTNNESDIALMTVKVKTTK